MPQRLVVAALRWARACYPEVTLNRYALACGFLEAFHGIQKEHAPQRSCFRFEYTGIKGLPLILEGGGRAGLRLGPMTGRRCSALAMGSLYSAQSLGLAGIRQGCRKPPKTFPWGTHVIERAFRRSRRISMPSRVARARAEAGASMSLPTMTDVATRTRFKIPRFQDSKVQDSRVSGSSHRHVPGTWQHYAVAVRGGAVAEEVDHSSGSPLPTSPASDR